MARERISDVTVKGCKGQQLIFRNFEGVANRYNNPGDRNFCLIIDEELASGVNTKVQTRFPPEPNGYLHIGHAKAICMDQIIRILRRYLRLIQLV